MQTKHSKVPKFLNCLLAHTVYNYTIPYFFCRSNLVKQIVFAQWKVLQYFFVYLELGMYLNIQFPIDFCTTSSHCYNFESFIIINELTFIIFLWDRDTFIPNVQVRNWETEYPKINVQCPLFWDSSLTYFDSDFFFFSIFNIFIPLMPSHYASHCFHILLQVLHTPTE